MRKENSVHEVLESFMKKHNLEEKDLRLSFKATGRHIQGLPHYEARAAHAKKRNLYASKEAYGLSRAAKKVLDALETQMQREES